MRRGGLAVVAVEELGHERAVVRRRIPEEMRLEPKPEGHELAGGAHDVPLQERAHGAGLREDAYVRRHRAPVGVRVDVGHEVGHVVPREEPARRDLRPAFEIGEELLVGGVLVERQVVGAAVGAEAHDHVRAHDDVLGRPARILIGECVQRHLRELGLDAGSDAVHEVYHQARLLSAVHLDALGAFGAFAPPALIHLAHLHEVRAGIPAERTLERSHELVLHLLVREAQLHRLALPLHEREPLRMGLEVIRRRHEHEESVVGAQAILEDGESERSAALGGDVVLGRVHHARPGGEVLL